QYVIVLVNVVYCIDIALCHVFVFFFFQAEDGIRDATVTGVQTCALPISGVVQRIAALLPERYAVLPGAQRCSAPPQRQDRKRGRSEERRVGKECRDRRGGQRSKTKKDGHR